MKDKKILLFIIPIGIIFFFLIHSNQKIEQPISLEKEEVVQVNTLQVEIKGAVQNPGVYTVEEGDRVEKVIEKSGGLLESADTSTINLSKILKDEMVIIIYTKEEIAEMKKGSTSIKYIENTCICPQIKNDACIEEKIENIEVVEENKSEKISINTASLEQLMTLSGIGKSKAQAIIAYREENGGFKFLDDITKVKGIGKALYEKIKDDITL